MPKQTGSAVVYDQLHVSPEQDAILSELMEWGLSHVKPATVSRDIANVPGRRDFEGKRSEPVGKDISGSSYAILWSLRGFLRLFRIFRYARSS